MARTVFSIVFTAITILGFLLTCGVPAATAEMPDILIIEGMAPNTSAYQIAAAVGDALKKETGITTQVTAGTASAQVVKKINEFRSQFGISTSDQTYNGFHGLEQWQGNALRNLRVVCGITSSAVQLITWPDTGINSVRDLKGKTVMGAQVASENPIVITKAALKANGMTLDDIKLITWKTYFEQIIFMRSKRGNAIFMAGGVKTAPMMELDRTIKWKFISFTDKEIEAILKAAPYVQPFTMPANTYKQQPNEIKSVAAPMFFACNAGLPDDFIYGLCKILFDQPGRFKDVHAVWGKFDINYAIAPRAAPFHAAAVKYYKEKGVWDKDVDKWQANELKSAKLKK